MEWRQASSRSAVHGSQGPVRRCVAPPPSSQNRHSLHPQSLPPTGGNSRATLAAWGPGPRAPGLSGGQPGCDRSSPCRGTPGRRLSHTLPGGCPGAHRWAVPVGGKKPPGQGVLGTLVHLTPSSHGHHNGGTGQWESAEGHACCHPRGAPALRPGTKVYGREHLAAHVGHSRGRHVSWPS